MAYGTFIDSVLLHHPIGTPEIARKYRASFHALLSGNIGARGLEPQNLTDYGLLRQVTSEPIMVTGRVRQTAVIEPADGVVAQGTVYLKQLTGSIGWDVETMENASGDRQMLDIVTGKWDRFLNGFLGVLNAVDYGDGTGRLGRVSAYSSPTVTVDNSAQDFFVTKCALIEDGMLVDIYTVADITGTSAWTVKAKRVEVYDLDKTAGTFKIRAISGVTDSAISASPADGDFVFLSGAVTLTAALKFSSWDLPMGMHGILDDGGAAGHEFDDGTGYYNESYYGVTWQGLNRLTGTPLFKALVRRPTDWYGAADNSALCPATLETIFALFDDLYMSGSTPDPESQLVICSPPSYRWVEKRVVAEQNGMQDITKGHVLAGLGLQGFKVTAGSREIIVPVKSDLTVPNGRFLIADMGRIGTWEKQPLTGINPEGGGGNLQFATPGSRSLTVERWARTRYALFCPNCMTSGVLDGVDITA